MATIALKIPLFSLKDSLIAPLLPENNLFSVHGEFEKSISVTLKDNLNQFIIFLL